MAPTVLLTQFSIQYGVSVDVYSLSIIIFELFSSLDPFPGNLGQIFEAKRLDRKPAMPSDFPPHLKNFILCGWSKEPKNRPPLAECMAALNKMLNRDDKEIDNEATDRDNQKRITQLRKKKRMTLRRWGIQ